MSRIYDCFTFFNELELLDLRLHHLYDTVDFFVIVEGDHTFAGKPIPSLIKQNWDKFSWAKDKIRHYVVPLEPNPKSRWDNEELQRDSLSIGLYDAEPDDLILQGCVDEIPRLEVFKDPLDLTMLELDNFYYYLNGKDIGESAKYPCPVLTRKKNIIDGLNNLWLARYEYPLTHNAGWHFSYTGGVDTIIKKLESASHSELDTDFYKDKDRLKMALDLGKDFIDRPDHIFEYVKIDDSFPEYLVNNKDKFKHLIKDYR